ncbi:hypothetical protein Tco_1182227 [Tanacetum coccineum]
MSTIALSFVFCAVKVNASRAVLMLIINPKPYPLRHMYVPAQSRPETRYHVGECSLPTPTLTRMVKRKTTSTRSHANIKTKGKEIDEEDSDEEQTQRDKEIQRAMVLISKDFKNIYKPTNYNLRTSSNTENKNVDISPRQTGNDRRTGNKRQTEQYENQRVNIVTRSRETVGQQRVKDSAYHKEKMLLFKQKNMGFS